MGMPLSFRKAEKEKRQNLKKSFSMNEGGRSWIAGVDTSDAETSELTTIDVFS
jgi:hypothetical protein